jgi:hypothetical protein
MIKLKDILNESVPDNEMWHVSFKPDIKKFNPLSHFGTKEAAMDRLKQLKKRKTKFAYLYKVKLNMTSPAKVNDYPEYDDEDYKKYLMWLNDAKTFSSTISNDIATLQIWGEDGHNVKDFFIEIMEKMGYDGLVYDNEVEDVGFDSFVIFNPKQVKILKVMKINL